MKNFIPVFAFIFVLMSACTNAQTVGVKEFEKGLEANVQLIDVRTPEEFSEGHIKHARLMNVNEVAFEKEIHQLDKDKPVYVYCRSGKRSHTAYNKLKEQGFKNVVELKGGITAWEEAGKEVVKE